MKNKPTLYALNSWKYQIDTSSGNCINELRTLKTLSSVFEVYYNNEIFSDVKDKLGNEKENGPNKEYDFYYIRNNKEVFRSILGKKISFAYPYDDEVFSESAALLVLTENWKEHLLHKGKDSKKKLKYIYNFELPQVSCPVINVGQPYDEKLKNASPNNKDLFYLKARTLGSQVFGYYGNLNKDLYPYKAFSAIKSLNKSHPNKFPMVILAGNFRKNSRLTDHHICHIGNLTYDKMPALHHLTKANMTNESELNHCLGNQKVIDSLSRGIPVVCKNLDTFCWQLEDDYPGIYNNQEEAKNIIERIMMDSTFYEELKERSLKRSMFFSPENVKSRFLAQPDLNELLR